MLKNNCAKLPPTPQNVESDKTSQCREIYKIMIQENWDSFCCVVKKILKSETNQNIKYIKIIDLMANDEEMARLNTLLSTNEVNSFSRMIENSISAELDIKKVLNELTNEIKKMNLSTSGDKTFDKTLISMAVEDCIDFIKKNQSEAATLINYLPNSTVAEVFNQLELEEVDKLMALMAETPASNIDVLKEKLIGEQRNEKKNYFHTSIVELSEELSNKKQAIVIKNLLDLGEVSAVKTLANRSFPEECFLMLEGTLLRQLSNELDLDSKVKMLASLEEDDRDLWLTHMSDEGSKSREMIELELNQLIENELEFKRVQSNKETIIESTFDQFRKIISEEKYSSVREETIKHWISITQG